MVYCTLIIGYLLYKRQWRTVVFFGASLAVTFGLLLIAAHLYIEARPFETLKAHQLISHATGQSFPSDHTTVATALALALLAFTRFKVVGWLFLLFAFVIGYARIFVGVHYPLDIVGGIVTAAVGTTIVYIIYKATSPKAQSVIFDPKD